MTEAVSDNTFGETMRIVRERAGLSKRAMARELRANWDHIRSNGFLVSRWEDGRLRPPKDERIVFSLISMPETTDEERDLLISSGRLTKHQSGFILEIYRRFIKGRTYGELFGNSENNLA